MRTKYFSLFVIFCLLSSTAFGLPSAYFGTADVTKKIRVAPSSPKFSDAERQAELARRRAAVAARMADKSVMILFSAEPKLYTNDVDYVFRQENNLYYLTNLKQEGATLVIKKDGASITETVYLPTRDPRRETWEGRMYSNEDATNISGIRNIADAKDLAAYQQSVINMGDASVESVYLLLPDGAQDENGRREFRVEKEFADKLPRRKEENGKKTPGYQIENAQTIFGDLRHIKSQYELRLLQHAIDITTEAQMRSMATVGHVKMEYEVQAEVEYTFRRRNADFWGYPSIVGCGPNATTLHYVESQGSVKPGELLLMDVGAEYDHYTADVTRTYPVNGKFSKEQAEIYQIVYDAQEAVANAAKPGVTMSDLSRAADQVIKNGLTKLGLIESPDATYQVSFRGQLVKMPQHKIWYMHGLGHWLGMNVHDVGDYAKPMQPGMVFTNEPGIYIREDALNYFPDTPESKAFIAKIRPAFEKYKNIGVRIEDDMLITDSGVDWMTKNLPRSIADIEAFMTSASK